MKLLNLSILFILVGLNSAFCQCQLDTNVIINKTDTIDIPIVVKGITNNDLSNVNQGLCEVKINFEHVYIGDLLMWLISPSGQKIQLIGNEVMSGFTFGQSWDITFIQSGAAAMPDPGFMDKWSNDQNWAVGGTGGYTGSYYPIQSGLESFNIGAVNGIWTLHVEDRSRFYGGKITKLALIFCDYIGSDCAPCEPHSIEFDSPLIEACQYDEKLQFDSRLMIDIKDDSLSFYHDTLLIIRDDEIVAYHDTSTFDLRMYSVGQYQICGISYYNKHRNELPSIGTIGWSQWITDLENSNHLICAESSLNCINVIIHEIPDTVFIQEVFCQDASFEWGDTTISTAGQYIRQTKTVSGECDSIVVLDLSTVVLNAKIEVPDTLTCMNDSIVLDGSRSVIGSNTSWSWHSNNPAVILNSDNEFQKIADVGLYKLILKEGVCSDTATIEVVQDTSLPMFSVLTDTLSCQKDSVCLDVNSNNPNYTYTWTYKGVVISNLEDICVKDTGIYELEVASVNGCNVSRKVPVFGDFEVVSPTIQQNDITCRADTAWLELLNHQDYIDFFWEDEMGNQFKKHKTFKIDAGILKLVLFAKNGCVKIDTFNIQDLREDIIVELEMDSLSCNLPIVIPELNTSARIVEYRWSSGVSFESDKKDPKITEAGVYYVHIIDDKGCSWDSTFEIFIDTLVPTLRYEIDSITCLENSAGVQVFGDTSGISFLWINNEGFERDDAEPILPSIGEYFVILTAENGCKSIDTITVLGDTLLPVIQLDATPTKFDCFINDSILIKASSQLNSADYTWFYNNLKISDSSYVIINNPGWYHIQAIGSSDCISNDSILIDIDTLSPIFSAIGSDTLTCLINELTWQLVSNDSLDYFLIENGHEVPIQDSVLFSSDGTYTILGRAENHCESTIDITLVYDTLSPDLFTADDTLDCLIDSIPLKFNSNELIDSFYWTRNGQTIKDDLIGVPGLYTVRARSLNGCWAEAEIEILEDRIIPNIDVLGGIINCHEDSITLLATNIDQLDSITWFYNNAVIGMHDSVKVGSAGSYNVQIYSPNGCTNDTTISVRVDTMKPIYILNQLDTLDCFTDKSELLINFGNQIPPNLSFKWSTTNGQIISVKDNLYILVNEAGTYISEVLDNRNGCISIQEITIEDHRVDPDSASLVIDHIDCMEIDDGQIEIKNVHGGKGPFLYSFDNGGFSNTKNWSDLAPGDYRIEIRSSFGCLLDTIITIADAPKWFVDAGMDQKIFIGEEVDLNATTNIPISEIDAIEWIDNQWLTCSDCLNPTASPLTDYEYEIHILTKNGCLVSDRILIEVIEGVAVYVPNSFTPNDDGLNDRFDIELFPESVVSFKGQIYSRWGEKLVDLSIENPSKSIDFWDGTFQNKRLLPGVYIYQIELELPSGNHIIKKGTITLLR